MSQGVVIALCLPKTAWPPTSDGNTNRETTKNFVAERVSENPYFKDNILGAMIRGNISGWGNNNEENN